MKTIFRTLRVSILLLLLAASARAATSEELARQLLDETNLARTQPQRYAEYLREFRKYFVGKAYRVPGAVALVVTSEGVPAVDEAINFLMKQRPVQALTWSPGLAKSALDLVREQAGSGVTGHDGSNGNLRTRIERHGTWKSGIAENISYGPETARLITMELIIDDGVADRGHRKNMFNGSFGTAGAACGPHPVYRKTCVMDFAVGFQSK